MNRHYSVIPIAPALLPPHGGAMLVLHEAGRADDHIEYIRRADAENAAFRWMNGEDILSIKKTADGNADSSDSSSSTPSLTPKPTRPNPPSM